MTTPPAPTDRLFFGADPDMHHAACAVVRADLTVAAVWVHRASKNLTEQAAILHMAEQLSVMDYSGFRVEAFCVEAQEIYKAGPHRTKNPRSILHLGHVAGALVYKCFEAWPAQTAFFPVPSKWKGQIDKLPHHRRILEAAGIPADHVFEKRTKGKRGKDSGYCGVKAPFSEQFLLEPVADGQWMHITDAIGLAQYAAGEYAYQTKKAELLATARGPK